LRTVENPAFGPEIFSVLKPRRNRTEGAKDWLLWQLADSAFPTGGFAHSGGLEAASQQGEIRSPAELASFIQTSLDQAGQAALPFVTEVFYEPHRFGEIDRLCDAFLSNHVANRASRSQGQAMLLTVERAFALPSLRALRCRVLAEKLPGHLAPVFGAVTRQLEVDHSSALRLFLFLVLRTLVAGAVRLGLIGPLDGQRMQSRLAPLAEQIKCRCKDLRAIDAAQTAPLLEILHGAHDRLYSRLFHT
jgi:urease accessory protein